ncbi:MAG: JAB domain-containing protein, partial [Oscillospiraceae bacterium]
MSSIHDGHRQRLKTRFVKSGLKDFEPHIALELILTFSIPRRDTNELAHRLIERYGSFDKVLEADYTSLLQVDGIGENTAAQLKVIFESYAYYEAQKYRKGFVAASSSVAMKYAQSLFVGEQSEVSYLMCFDSKLKLINCPEITRGSISQTAVSVKRIVELATLHRASSVIVTHNHPNGVAMPSEDDIAATSTIMKALNLIDVKLSDHIVV